MPSARCTLSVTISALYHNFRYQSACRREHNKERARNKQLQAEVENERLISTRAQELFTMAVSALVTECERRQNAENKLWTLTENLHDKVSTHAPAAGASAQVQNADIVDLRAKIGRLELEARERENHADACDVAAIAKRNVQVEEQLMRLNATLWNERRQHEEAMRSAKLHMTQLERAVDDEKSKKDAGTRYLFLQTCDLFFSRAVGSCGRVAAAVARRDQRARPASGPRRVQHLPGTSARGRLHLRAYDLSRMLRKPQSLSDLSTAHRSSAHSSYLSDLIAIRALRPLVS